MVTYKWSRLGVIAAASLLGGATAYWVNVLTRKPLSPPACEIRTFDHVGFLRVVDSQKKQTSEQLAALASATDPIDRLILVHLSFKLQSLASLGAVVEQQVRKGGSTYACVEPAYKLFMYTLDYPTFAALSRQAELDYLWQRVAREVNRPWYVSFTQGAASSLPTAFIAAIGLYLVERRERRKGQQRIQLADKLPQ